MLKKSLIAVALIFVVCIGGAVVWVRSVLANDGVRTAVAAQLSKSLGQPVTIGSIGATIYPRVTVNLGEVGIGQPAKITIRTLRVGTDFGALLSRRIEHATMNLSGARIELPLPDFAVASSAPSAPSDAKPASSPPVEIVSIDEVVLSDVEIVSGGRTLKGSIDVVPQGKGVAVRRISLGADSATIDITGQISDLAGPSGELTVKAGALNFDQLLAFVSDFAGGAGTSAAPAQGEATSPAPASSSGMNLVIAVDADKATMGGLTIDKLSGKARLTADNLRLEPASFGLFGGKYEGTLALSLGRTPDFQLKAKLSGVDMAAATAFAGSPNTVTGRLSGTVDLAGRGMDAPAVLKTARGSARVDITDGTVKNLGLIQTVVVATSGRADASGKMGGGSRDEPFTRMGATLSIAGGSASTQDLKFESKDIMLSAAGGLKLDGSALNFQGQVQLSDELSKQAGRDLVRYTQDQGRVTLPATITGSADDPQIRIDVASMAKRAITNRATEEAQKAIKKSLGGFLQKK
jgi:uncharacterized protein involved in outer membrane biogenesis